MNLYMNNGFSKLDELAKGTKRDTSVMMNGNYGGFTKLDKLGTFKGSNIMKNQQDNQFNYDDYGDEGDNFKYDDYNNDYNYEEDQVEGLESKDDDISVFVGQTTVKPWEKGYKSTHGFDDVKGLKHQTPEQKLKWFQWKKKKEQQVKKNVEELKRQKKNLERYGDVESLYRGKKKFSKQVYNEWQKSMDSQNAPTQRVDVNKPIFVTGGTFKKAEGSTVKRMKTVMATGFKKTINMMVDKRWRGTIKLFGTIPGLEMVMGLEIDENTKKQDVEYSKKKAYFQQKLEALLDKVIVRLEGFAKEMKSMGIQGMVGCAAYIKTPIVSVKISLEISTNSIR